MYRVLGAFVSARKMIAGQSGRQDAQLLSSSCRLLSLASPGVISAVSVSVAVPSASEAEQLAAQTEELAAACGLIAAIERTSGRLRVRFLRQPEGLGALSGRQ